VHTHGHSQDGGPATLENVNVDEAVRVDVRVVGWGLEVARHWFEGVIVRDFDEDGEDSGFVGGS
jgi:hypothetical protein